MADPAYAAEVEWIRGQLSACSCVCCHQGSVTKEGATIWDLELEGNFLNSFSPWGLAFMAGFVDSSILGGLIVKVGSRMMDNSLRTKLNSIKHAMKEAG